MIHDPVPFLANIILIANADGVLSATELGQLEAIRTEFKFKKSDMNQAKKLVENGQHQITPIGSFADQVKNLELMLRVALADDEIDAKEAELLKDFCRKIGITPEQLTRIRREVLLSLHQQHKLCPKCGAGNDKDANFCHKCGNSLVDERQDIRTQFDIPAQGIAIEFADSTAATFPQALEIAKNTPGYQTIRRGSKNWHLAVFPSGNIEDALPLAEQLSGLRNRAVYIDGEKKDWNEVLGFAWCYAQRACAYRPEEHCFGKEGNRLNPWGCIQARMDWTAWSDWFSFGHWERSGTLKKHYIWRFDKSRIRHELATNLYRFRFCPHLQQDLIEAVLKHLPDTVDPQNDPNWTYRQNWEEVPNAVKVVVETREDGLTFKQEFWSDGVRPVGLKGYMRLLSDALAEIGASPQLAVSMVRN